MCPTDSNQDDKLRFLKALGANSGNVKKACLEVGRARSVYYHWRKTDPDFAMQCDIIIGSHKDAPKPVEKPIEVRHEDEGDLTIEPERYRGVPAEVIAAEHIGVLRSSMKSAGIYDPAYEPQIRMCARLYASVQILFSQLDSYTPLQTEISREGNPRLVANPIHEMIRRQSDTYTACLKALGLNFDSKVRVREEDGFESFIKAMNDD